MVLLVFLPVLIFQQWLLNNLIPKKGNSPAIDFVDKTLPEKLIKLNEKLDILINSKQV